MRTLIALLAYAAMAAPAAAAPDTSSKQAALQAGDWHRAAELGASAAEVVRALQAKHRFSEAVPGQSVVTIDADNQVEVVALKPLPPLPKDAAARTVGLAGSGFLFRAKWGSIILYPPGATSFTSR